MNEFNALSNYNFDDYFAKNIFYKGCYPNDRMDPKMIKKIGEFIIINVDASNLSGSHWFSLKKVKNHADWKFLDNFIPHIAITTNF